MTKKGRRLKAMKTTGEKLKIEEEDGDCVLDVWINNGDDAETPFTGQGGR